MPEEYKDETTESTEETDDLDLEGDDDETDEEDDTSASQAGRRRREPPAKNLASEALRRENAEIKRELEALKRHQSEEGGTLQALRDALTNRGNKSGQKTAQEEPPDPVDDPEAYNEFVRKTSREEGGNAASAIIRQNTRTLLTNQAQTEFLKSFPSLAVPGVWDRILPKAQRMFQRGDGSGDAGALTVADIEGLAWSEFRGEMQTLAARKAEARTVENWRKAENASGIRGRSRTSKDYSKMSVAELTAEIESLPENEKADVIDSLPWKLQEKLLA
uniref:Uncharacterized protein n=1 Tax=viral metagenome TaxID=1070528 RepID=A0A6M3LB17_9ZZZZ